MFLHVDVFTRAYDKSLLEENLKYFWKCIQNLSKSFFSSKIKGLVLFIKNGKIIIFSLLAYTYVMSKLTQDLILC